MAKRSKSTGTVPGFTPAPAPETINYGLPARQTPLDECKANVEFLVGRLEATEKNLNIAKSALRRELAFHELRAEEIAVALNHLGVTV